MRDGAVLVQEVPSAKPAAPFGSAGTVRPWSVMHATEDVRPVLELAEAQRALGMRPVLVTPAGYGSIELYLRSPRATERSVSLLSTWQRVRQWRKSLADCGAAAAMEIVHAHSFAAGMSGVRNWPVVVYDLADFVEHDAEPDQQWLARSLRVAEQFVLARAEAVVLHQASLREKALERGATAEHLFVVPQPLPRERVCAAGWREALEVVPGDVVLLAADAAQEDPDALLSAFAQVVSEAEGLVLLLRAADPAGAALQAKLAAAGIASALRMVSDEGWQDALLGADVVIAGTPPRAGADHACLSAMRAGRAVLAADVPANRDVSPEGQGCLWYKPGNARDLAGRAAFLARNADFRRSLGESARSFLESTRSPEAVARAYDAVYRHAFARRGDDTRQLMGRFEPLHATFF
jgi:glycosyltransferase involved in cell wall biosynthesis